MSPHPQSDTSTSSPTRARSASGWIRARRAAGTALLAVGALMLASCTTSGGTGDGEGKTFTIGIGVDLDTLDPAQQTTTTVSNVIDYGLETLTSLDRQGEATPGLATSWETSESGKVLTFHLREGVKFHDGTPFDAKAVKFNLDRIRDPKVKVPIGGAFTVIKDVEVVDPSTVRLSLEFPDPTLVSNLGITTSAIISPTSSTKGGNTYKNIVEPVGTGPYEFNTFEKGDKAVYEKYDGYWGKKPYYDSVVFSIIPEGNSREAVLQSGEAQMIMNPPVPDLEALDSDPDMDVLKAPSDRSIFVAFNNLKPPFDNVDVRRALNYAVNKESIVENVLFDTVDVMDSPLAASLTGHCPVGGYEYDPEKAKQLLDKAGAENLSITFGTPSGRYLQDKQAAEAIAANLRDVGLEVNVRTTDFPSYLAAIVEKDGPYDMHLLGWAPGALDAATQFQMFEKAQWPPTGLASDFYTNEKAESLIAEGNRELDDAKREGLYCDAQKQVWSDAPWMFLWSQNLILAYSHDVAGITYVPNEKFDTVYAHPAG